MQKSLTLDRLAADLDGTVGFLQALNTALPGHVDEELLRYLEGMRGNPLALELLLRALTQPEVRR